MQAVGTPCYKTILDKIFLKKSRDYTLFVAESAFKGRGIIITIILHYFGETISNPQGFVTWNRTAIFICLDRLRLRTYFAIGLVRNIFSVQAETFFSEVLDLCEYKSAKNCVRLTV